MPITPLLRTLTPGPLRKRIRSWRVNRALRKHYRRDRKRYARHSAVLGTRADNLRAQITYSYHALEKGLSFSNCRPMFGRDKVAALLRQLTLYASIGDPEDSQFVSGIKTLQCYRDFHRQLRGLDISAIDALLDQIDQLVEQYQDLLVKFDGQFLGGTETIHSQDVRKQARGDFPSLCMSRSSIRHFAPGDVPLKKIEQAVRWSQKSPSVCNRQTGRAYVVTQAEMITKVLDLQKGTRGFSEQINKLIVVAGDLSVFLSPQERNQVFLDTGLFAMNLLYGLHYQGLGACILHWAVDGARDDALRELLQIRPQDTAVCLIGVGQLPDSLKIAVSQRIALDQVLLVR